MREEGKKGEEGYFREEKYRSASFPYSFPPNRETQAKLLLHFRVLGKRTFFFLFLLLRPRQSGALEFLEKKRLSAKREGGGVWLEKTFIF